MVMHKKATITLWFAKKTQVESVFFLIFGQFGSFRDVLGVVLGRFGANLISLLGLSLFSKKLKFLKDFLDDKISNCCVFSHLGSFYGHFTVILWSFCGQFGLNLFN